MRQLASLILLVSLAAGTVVIAQGAPSPKQQAVNARESHMRLYAFNLGQLGGMLRESFRTMKRPPRPRPRI